MKITGADGIRDDHDGMSAGGRKKKDIGKGKSLWGKKEGGQDPEIFQYAHIVRKGSRRRKGANSLNGRK